MLDHSQKKILFTLARQSIETELKLRSQIDSYPDEFLKDPAAVFVTLRIDDELRGCIGSVQAIESLRDAIVHSAYSAAFRDPRFSPLIEEEYPLIDLEISVLSPFQRVQNPGEVVPGVHGVMITRGYRRGLLLPQVAVEYNWDRETFLGYTCDKAGLPFHAWKDPNTTIEVFTAEVFSERDHSDKNGSAG
jgi:AmmeMemoRadiSam system protein A